MIDDKDKIEISDEKTNKILKFLQLSRDGKYAPIDESSLPYVRMTEEREEVCQEEYYYNLT